MKGKLQKATPPPHPHTRRVWKGIPSVTNASLSLWSGIWRTIKGRKFTFYRTHSYIAQNVYNMHLLSLYLANNKNIFRRAAGRKKECRGPSEGSLTPKLTPLTPTPRGLLPIHFTQQAALRTAATFPPSPETTVTLSRGDGFRPLKKKPCPAGRAPRGSPKTCHRQEEAEATSRGRNRPGRAVRGILQGGAATAILRPEVSN